MSHHPADESIRVASQLIEMQATGRDGDAEVLWHSLSRSEQCEVRVSLTQISIFLLRASDLPPEEAVAGLQQAMDEL